MTQMKKSNSNIKNVIFKIIIALIIISSCSIEEDEISDEPNSPKHKNNIVIINETNKPKNPPSTSSTSTDSTSKKEIAKDFGEYCDIFFKKLEVPLKKEIYKKQFWEFYNHMSYPYIELDFYSNKYQNDDEYMKICKSIYDDVLSIINEIDYQPKGVLIFKDDVYINLTFYKHDCKIKNSHYINRSCFEHRGYMRFDIQNKEYDKFKYKD